MVEQRDLIENVATSRGPHTFIKHKGAAEIIAHKVNDAMNQAFPPDQPVNQGQRSQFAEDYHEKHISDFTVEIAAENAEMDKELNIDRLTGLYTGRKFLADGGAVLKDAIQYQRADEVVVDRDKLKRLFIARSDIGFLGYANTLSGGHDRSGDQYKATLMRLESCLSPEMKSFAEKSGVQVSGYALTKGDESALLVVGSQDQIKVLLTKIAEEVSRLKIGIPGDNPLLPASLNIDYVSAEEYLDRYLGYARTHAVESEKFYVEYLYLLSSLADFKADLQKVIERLRILRDTTKNCEEGRIGIETYRHLGAHILKGAAEVSEAELYGMVMDGERVSGDEEFQRNARQWTLDKFTKRVDNALKSAATSGISELDQFLLQVKKEILTKMETNNG